MTAPIYAFSYTDIDGHLQPLAQHQGRVMLLVNTASACGFTEQYAGLQLLHRELGPRGLVVIGFPCNQFGGQEAGGEAAIKQFCQARFGVDFSLSQKVQVRGSDAHPIFRYLCQALPGVLGTEAIKWNFTKFVVGADGQPLYRFGPKDTPQTLQPQLVAALAAVTAHPPTPAPA